MPAKNWCRGASAAITIALQPRRAASAAIRLDGLRVASTLPLASTPSASNLAIAAATLSRCWAHSCFDGNSQGLGKPKATPQIRAMARILTVPPRPANAAACAMAGRLNALPSEARRILLTRSLDLLLQSAHPGIFDIGAVPVEWQVGEQHRPAQPVINPRATHTRIDIPAI